MNATTTKLPAITSMSTAELVAEYNALTGKAIKKFSSRAAGEKQVGQARADQARLQQAKVEPKPEAKPASQAKDKKAWPFGKTAEELGITNPKQDKEPAAPAPKKEVKPVPKNAPSGYARHGLTHCPHCGIDLNNGVGEHNQEVNGKKIKHEKFEYECMACGKEFGPKIKGKQEVNADRSTAISETWNDPKVAAARATRNRVKVVGGEEYRSVLEAFQKLRLPVSRHIRFRMELKASPTGRATFDNDGVKTQFILVKAEA